MNLTLNDIREDIRRAVSIALQEDIGSGDITALLIPEEKTDIATIITREDCVLCGTAWVDETFKQLGGLASIEWHVADGDHAPANTTLATLDGNTRTLLTGERTALNFLQLLSGTATTANQYAKALGDSSIKILDTRKTLPGLRTAQKYAVAVGGCHNHRIGLYDAYLIKENHIAACGSIGEAVAKARAYNGEAMIEVEVETLAELQEALNCRPEVIMLDEFTNAEIQQAIHLRSLAPDSCSKLEISGNITALTLRDHRATPVDFISTGSLTKHVKAIDLSMRLCRE